MSAEEIVATAAADLRLPVDLVRPAVVEVLEEERRDGMLLCEIAAALGVSTERARQIEARAFRKLLRGGKHGTLFAEMGEEPPRYQQMRRLR